MRRVIVAGAGAGKSTPARALGDRTGLPVLHLDHIYWLPDWQARPRGDPRAMALEIEGRDAWTFEGGLSSIHGHRVSRADTVIWLDLAVALRMWRVTQRLFQFYGQCRPDLAEGCIEGLHAEPLIFYRCIWKTRETGRKRLAALFADAPGHGTLHHLMTRTAMRQILAAT